MSGDPASRGDGSLTCVAATHIGKREVNEDAWRVEGNLILLADGVGGHRAGEIASAMACEVVAREVAAGTTLQSAVALADQEIRSSEAQGVGRAGMATTIVAALHDGREFELAWVGDSRAYLWDGRLHLLTADHSEVHDLWRRGALSMDEVSRHPRKHLISQALGMPSATGLRIDNNRVSLGRDDCLLLCSDGLTDVLATPTLASLLESITLAGDLDTHSRERKLASAVDKLVASAVKAGGFDNITTVLIANPFDSSIEDSDAEQRIWSFDPATGKYSGLPQRALAAPLLGETEGPVSPRRVGGGPRLPEPGAVDQPSARASGGGRPAHRTRWMAVWICLAVIVVAGLVLFGSSRP